MTAVLTVKSGLDPHLISWFGWDGSKSSGELDSDVDPLQVE